MTLVMESSGGVERIWSLFNIEILRADKGETSWVWSSAGMQVGRLPKKPAYQQIARHNPHLLKPGGNPVGNRTRYEISPPLPLPTPSETTTRNEILDMSLNRKLGPMIVHRFQIPGPTPYTQSVFTNSRQSFTDVQEVNAWASHVTQEWVAKDKYQLTQACRRDNPLAACALLAFSRLNFCVYLKNVLVLIVLGVLRANKDEVRRVSSSAGIHGGGNGRSPRKPVDQRHRPDSSHSENPGATPSGIEPGSPRGAPVSPALAFRRYSIFASFHPHWRSMLGADQNLSTTLPIGMWLRPLELPARSSFTTDSFSGAYSEMIGNNKSQYQTNWNEIESATYLHAFRESSRTVLKLAASSCGAPSFRRSRRHPYNNVVSSIFLFNCSTERCGRETSGKRGAVYQRKWPSLRKMTKYSPCCVPESSRKSSQSSSELVDQRVGTFRSPSPCTLLCRRHGQIMRLRACCYDSDVCVAPVDRRGSYAATSGYWTTQCDHSTGWPPSCPHGCGHVTVQPRPQCWLDTGALQRLWIWLCRRFNAVCCGLDWRYA
ncbi:hypothetical protein PR048_015227 [Dryococelus australis]|uniref:Uncharacterized protein n=1 Tax=Dryococelus australis TaxID=614101 RepID=A0ABQ9HGI1_9NEOP|nr:hypothetical protein PR048_015227 [Dryococelus australis]